MPGFFIAGILPPGARKQTPVVLCYIVLSLQKDKENRGNNERPGHHKRGDKVFSEEGMTEM